MTDVLLGLEHTALDGVGNLGKLLSASGESAVYETRDVGTGTPAMIELRPDDSPESERLLARWHERIRLSHPNLLRVFAAGHASVNSVPAVYLVVERADESLAEVLAARPLIPEEATEILEPALSALHYLHENGYAHGRLEPSCVLAVGSTLKLSTEDVLRIDEGCAPADDMWAFGVVLVQAVTGVPPQFHPDKVPQLPQLSSEPLKEIMRHCLDVNPETRWTAQQALRWLARGTSPEVPSDQPVVIREHETASATPGNRKWIYASAAVLLLVGGIAWQSTRTSRPASPVSAFTPVAAPVPPAVPDAATPPPDPAPKVAAVPRRNRRANAWVVVIASYGARIPADKRVRDAAKKWPRFHVELVEAASEKAPLLVVIGKNLSEKEAEALRDRARSSGLPKDTYIKRIDIGNG